MQKQGSEEPMLTDLTSHEIILNFVNEDLRLHFKHLLSLMKGKRKLFITEALYALVSSLYESINQKLLSLGEGKNLDLRRVVFNHASGTRVYCAFGQNV